MIFSSSSRYECRSCKLEFKDFYSMEDHSRSCEDRSHPSGDHLRSSGDPSTSSFSLFTDSKPDIQRLVHAIRIYFKIYQGCIFSQIIRGVNFLKNHFETHFFPHIIKNHSPFPPMGVFLKNIHHFKK